MNQQGPPPKIQTLNIKEILLHLKNSELKTKSLVWAYMFTHLG